MSKSKGYKTTEFWLAMIATILGAAATTGILDDPGVPTWATKVAGVIAVALSSLGYTVGRSAVKAKEGEKFQW